MRNLVGWLQDGAIFPDNFFVFKTGQAGSVLLEIVAEQWTKAPKAFVYLYLDSN
jgi:hypothetical protein